MNSLEMWYFIIFGVDNSSSSHTGIRKDSFSVLCKGSADGINDIIGAAEKSKLNALLNFTLHKYK